MQVARGHNVVTVKGNSAMASIRKRNGKWQVQVRKKGSSPIGRSFTLRADAQEWARETERLAERRGLHSDPKLLNQITVRDLLTRYYGSLSQPLPGLLHRLCRSRENPLLILPSHR